MFSIQKLGVTCLNVVKNVVPQDEIILFQSLKITENMLIEKKYVKSLINSTRALSNILFTTVFRLPCSPIYKTLIYRYLKSRL